MIKLTLLIPTFKRNTELRNLLLSIKSSYDSFCGSMRFGVVVVNDDSEGLGSEIQHLVSTLSSDTFIFQCGRNLGKMRAIQEYLLQPFFISEFIVVIDSDDIVRPNFLQSLNDALITNNRFYSFCTNMSKGVDETIVETYHMFRFNNNNMEDRVDVFPFNVFREEIIASNIREGVLHMEYLLYSKIYSKSKIVFLPYVVVDKKYQIDGYTKNKLAWIKKSKIEYLEYYSSLMRQQELSLSKRVKSLLKYLVILFV